MGAGGAKALIKPALREFIEGSLKGLVKDIIPHVLRNSMDDIARFGGPEAIEAALKTAGPDLVTAVIKNGAPELVENLIKHGGPEIVQTVVRNMGDDIIKTVTAEGGERVIKQLVESGAKGVVGKLLSNGGDAIVGKVLASGADDIVKKMLKEGGEGIVEKMVKEGGEGIVEKMVKEGGEDIVGRMVREGGEGIVGRMIREGGEGVVGRMVNEGGTGVVEKMVKEGGEGIIEKMVKESSDELLAKLGREGSEELIEKFAREGGEEFAERLMKKAAGNGFKNAKGILSKSWWHRAPSRLERLQFGAIKTGLKVGVATSIMGLFYYDAKSGGRLSTWLWNKIKGTAQDAWDNLPEKMDLKEKFAEMDEHLYAAKGVMDFIWPENGEIATLNRVVEAAAKVEGATPESIKDKAIYHSTITEGFNALTVAMLRKGMITELEPGLSERQINLHMAEGLVRDIAKGADRGHALRDMDLSVDKSDVLRVMLKDERLARSIPEDMRDGLLQVYPDSQELRDMFQRVPAPNASLDTIDQAKKAEIEKHLEGLGIVAPNGSSPSAVAARTSDAIKGAKFKLIDEFDFAKLPEGSSDKFFDVVKKVDEKADFGWFGEIAVKAVSWLAPAFNKVAGGFGNTMLAGTLNFFDVKEKMKGLVSSGQDGDLVNRFGDMFGMEDRVNGLLAKASGPTPAGTTT